MSRSRKKYPIIGLCCSGKTGMRDWKKMCNRVVRRMKIEDERIINYKKINDPWNNPQDGRQWSDDPKHYRK